MDEFVEIEREIGIFSFFSGAGFLDLGFEKTNGFEVMFVNDVHQPFIDIYRHSREKLNTPLPIFGTHTADIDDFLRPIKSEILEDCIQQTKASKDFIGFIGGPPCPDFSVGGKNRGKEGDNGKLSESYIDLIIANSPDFFLFENVKGLYRTAKHREFFDYLKDKLIAADYHLTERLVNSIEYGVAQDRDRIILLGFKSEVLESLNISPNINNKVEPFNWFEKVKHKKSILENEKWPTQETFNENESKEKPKGVNKSLTVQHWFDKNNVENHPNSKHHFQPRAGLPKFQTILEGDDSKKSYKRLHRWRYSPTAAYGNNEVHLHPYKARRISVSEALSIQSLPKKYEMPADVSLTNMFKSIGNGVPYLLAKGLSETIYKFLSTQHVISKTNEKTNSEQLSKSN
jgi:DNA (cytosine-5)-methyltransferase 1